MEPTPGIQKMSHHHHLVAQGILAMQIGLSYETLTDTIFIFEYNVSITKEPVLSVTGNALWVFSSASYRNFKKSVSYREVLFVKWTGEREKKKEREVAGFPPHWGVRPLSVLLFCFVLFCLFTPANMGSDGDPGRMPSLSLASGSEKRFSRTASLSSK